MANTFKMIRVFLFFIAFTFTIGNVLSQKLYEWKPPAVNFAVRNDVSTNDTVFLIIKDRRVNPEKLKSDTDSKQILSAIISDVKRAFPNVLINDKLTPKEGKFNIIINLSSYGAGFGTEISAGVGMVGGNINSFIFPKGKWNAITALTCTIIKSNKKETREFSNVSSKDNLWGYKSSRKALEETYSSTINNLLLYIEDAFMF